MSFVPYPWLIPLSQVGVDGACLPAQKTSTVRGLAYPFAGRGGQPTVRPSGRDQTEGRPGSRFRLPWPVCQRRSKNRPLGRSKSRPFGGGARDGRRLQEARRKDLGAVVFAGVGGWRGLGRWELAALAGLGLAQTIALAVHFENMDAMGQAVEQSAGHALIAENAGPFLERQVRCNDGRTSFVALAEGLEQQFGADLGKRHIAEFVDDQQFDGGEPGGTPPELGSRDLVAITAYLGSISKGQPVDIGAAPKRASERRGLRPSTLQAARTHAEAIPTRTTTSLRSSLTIMLSTALGSARRAISPIVAQAAARSSHSTVRLKTVSPSTLRNRKS